jgi:hypothetical protein
MYLSDRGNQQESLWPIYRHEADQSIFLAKKRLVEFE